MFIGPSFDRLVKVTSRKVLIRTDSIIGTNNTRVKDFKKLHIIYQLSTA